jgi:hypothetical protein
MPHFQDELVNFSKFKGVRHIFYLKLHAIILSYGLSIEYYIIIVCLVNKHIEINVVIFITYLLNDFITNTIIIR